MVAMVVVRLGAMDVVGVGFSGFRDARQFRLCQTVAHRA